MNNSSFGLKDLYYVDTDGNYHEFCSIDETELTEVTLDNDYSDIDVSSLNAGEYSIPISDVQKIKYYKKKKGNRYLYYVKYIKITLGEYFEECFNEMVR